MVDNQDINDAIVDQNRNVQVENIINNNSPKSKSNISVFHASPEEIIEGKDQKVVCKDCTKKFFSLFFRNNSNFSISEMQESEDIFDRTVANSQVLMKWNPEQKIWQCPNDPINHIELPRDEIQIKNKKKQLVAAGINNYPELFPYMQNQDMLAADEILTANSKTKDVNKHRNKDIFFIKEQEEMLQDQTMFIQPKHTKRVDKDDDINLNNY